MIKKNIFILMLFTNVKCRNFEDSFNILMKDSAVYSIEEFLGPDDYEMIDVKDINRENIDDILFDLNKLAEEEYYKTTNTPLAEETQDIENDFLKKSVKCNTAVENTTNHIVHKRDIMVSAEEVDYDYDELLNDYIGSDNNGEIITNDGEGSHIAVNDVMCIINETLRQSPKVIMARLWNNLKIWLVVYLVVAVPLWCTKGWCCCCLCCKLLQPQRTIQDAKQYYMTNPPGVLNVPNSGVICYEATEREKESYEKFGHIIRTI
ncbi:PREDICTED: uncharacterized protein LOC106120194 [Papilio xuthus]|uniref:Uncharacterized protein LOC106120194 n=1 Tax=Papilio xuthus TaxID=66420 RepID=A0AAJ6ZER8_PAPXU|nr:PREDICTED: uncharacterized protein LOC106120194 [Papilio xuthus]